MSSPVAAGPAPPSCWRKFRALARSSGAGWPSLSAKFHGGRHEQVRDAEAESFGDKVQGLHRRISRAPLEMTHIGAVHADREAESFLGVPGLRAKGADDLAEAMEQLG